MKNFPSRGVGGGNRFLAIRGLYIHEKELKASLSFCLFVRMGSGGQLKKKLNCILMSSIFTLQEMLVESILESQRLVPVIVAFADRLLGCQKHRWLGENLLQKFDEHLLPKVAINYQLVSCFSVFNRMAENDTIPPSGLLGLFAKFMLFLVEKHGPDTGIKSWSLGSKVLGICRTLLMHHQSSRLFLKMSHLLAFTCLYFPDLEVRDNARYLSSRLSHVLSISIFLCRLLHNLKRCR